MRLFNVVVLALVLFWTQGTQGGVPIPGLHSGPTPFQSIFATGFNSGYGSFGTGTVAGAIGAYGRFVSGGSGSIEHGHGGGHGSSSGGGGYGRK